MDTNVATGGQRQNSQLPSTTPPLPAHFISGSSRQTFPFFSPGSFSSLPTTRTQHLFQHPGLQLPNFLPTDATLTPAWCKGFGHTTGTGGVWDERRLRAPSSRSVMCVAELADVLGAVGVYI